MFFCSPRGNHGSSDRGPRSSVAGPLPGLRRPIIPPPPLQEHAGFKSRPRAQKHFVLLGLKCFSYPGPLFTVQRFTRTLFHRVFLGSCSPAECLYAEVQVQPREAVFTPYPT